jgi:chromosome segregation ATPase
VVEFEKTVVALRRELKETLMSRRHLEEELVIERNTVEELRNQVSVKKDECKRMESLVSTIDMSKSDLIHRLAVSEREIEKYKREVQESVSESSARVAELEILRKDLVEYKEHMLFLSKQKDEMQSVCDDQAERLDLLNQQLRQQELGQVEVHRTLENHKRRVVQLEEQLASKEDSIRSLSSRLSMASDELTRTASELVQRKRELTDAMDDVRVLVDETNKFKNLLGDSDRSLQTSRRDSADIKKRIDAVLQALRATELERDDVLTLYRQSIQDLDHCKFVLSTVDREKSQLQTAVADALKAIEETRYRESSLRQEIATRDLDIAALKDRLQLVTVQLDQMLADSEEGRRGVGRLMHELKMQEELNRIVEDHKVAFEREIARLENDAHHLATKLKSTQNLLEQKTQALQDAEERYNVLAAYRAAAASDQDERPQQSAGGVSELLQTIEQQYRMIGELDSEVEQLKTKLKSRGDA